MQVIKLNTCRGCKFGDGPLPNGMMECTRFPPTVTATLVPQANKTMGVAMQATFPQLPPERSCGEWKPRIELAATDPHKYNFGQLSIGQ